MLVTWTEMVIVDKKDETESYLKIRIMRNL